MNKILIDTDPGDDIDDILAIAFALQREELEVLAITTVTTFSHKRAELIKKLVQLCGKAHIPVAAGVELPLRKITSEEYDRMTNNNGYVLNQYPAIEPIDEPGSIEDIDAAELIIRMVEQYPNEVTIAAIGPMSNLAVALRKKPSIAAKIKQIAIMGGEVQIYRAEHNIAWDPNAADIVLTSGIPIFLGTWELTRRFVLLREHCDMIKNHGTPLCDFLSTCIDLWWPHKAHKIGPVMYDISPIIWSYDKSYFETTPMEIRVETSGEFTKGVTVQKGNNYNAEVTVGIKENDILELYLKTICG